MQEKRCTIKHLRDGQQQSVPFENLTQFSFL
ncbi:MAG: hypothetical protein NVV59_14480 [Chitinophagaceae bacterium]|nr:hypothetical protein [Chitinophagaceae bacterium]